MIKLLFSFLLVLSVLTAPQRAIASSEFIEILNKNVALIQKSSSKTVAPVLAEIQSYGTRIAVDFLKDWKNKELFFIKESSRIIRVDSTGKNEDGKK